MLTFILSRGVPTPKYSTNGIFEFDQARALKQTGCNVVFLALDLRSVRRTRPWGFQSFEKDGVPVRVADNPTECVAKGTAAAFGYLDQLADGFSRSSTYRH